MNCLPTHLYWTCPFITAIRMADRQVQVGYILSPQKDSVWPHGRGQHLSFLRTPSWSSRNVTMKISVLSPQEPTGIKFPVQGFLDKHLYLWFLWIPGYLWPHNPGISNKEIIICRFLISKSNFRFRGATQESMSSIEWGHDTRFLVQ